jgi:very-short-patch-repair endonuclease
VQHAKTSDTDIERILEGLLIALDIKYNKQYAIPDCRTVPDFFVAPNIAIYADGVYWHNKPRAKRRDSRINSMLEKRGYRTLRFPGDVLKNNPDSVKEILAQEVIDAD